MHRPIRGAAHLAASGCMKVAGDASPVTTCSRGSTNGYNLRHRAPRTGDSRPSLQPSSTDQDPRGQRVLTDGRIVYRPWARQHVHKRGLDRRRDARGVLPLHPPIGQVAVSHAGEAASVFSDRRKETQLLFRRCTDLGVLAEVVEERRRACLGRACTSNGQ
jgi:hypothetical protein